MKRNPTEMGEKIRRAREALGWSQEKLGKAVGISQPAIDKIESGETRKSKHLPDIQRVLRMSDDLPHGAIPLAETAPTKLMPVHGLKELGSGKMLFISQPVDTIPCPTGLARVSGVYGLLVRGQEMAPRYRPGEMIIMHPHLPPMPTDGVVIFSPDDEFVKICEYLGETDEDWIVKTYKPVETEFKLAKSDWPKCHLVHSVQSRR